jgi:hypothetical protein
MMVLIALAERGHVATRSSQTKDADVLVDVCTVPDVLARVVHELEKFGYNPIEEFGEGDFARFTFVSIGGGQIDVLCPEDTSLEELHSVPGIESLAKPGGRRALEVADSVRITYDDLEQDVIIRVPLLLGALVVKAAAAVDLATAGQPRHIQDVVDMLIGMDDPEIERDEITEQDRSLLRSLSDRMTNDGDMAWDGLDAERRQLARAAYELLVV